MTISPDWISAIGTVAGSLLAAVAAWISYFTANKAKNLTEKSIIETKRQAKVNVVQELIKDYADEDIYNARNKFGNFVSKSADSRIGLRL